MASVASVDGTTIDYDIAGSGPVIVFVAGVFNLRDTFTPLAAELGSDHTVLTYDRRGRGESGDTAPYSIEREVEDLQAIIEAAGGSASVFGFSSGAILALKAVADGVAVERLYLEAVRAHVTARGFDVAVAWGRVRGIDIDARHPDGCRYLIEAKAEVGKNGPQQVNYFVGMLGELVQRMDDVQASYGIALPDNRQYRDLVNRLPALTKERLRLAVFLASRERDELIVEVES